MSWANVCFADERLGAIESPPPVSDSTSVIPNFRDAGGCQTTDGRMVASGLLYRSAAFPLDSGSTALQMLENLGIRRVIDLRDLSELEAGYPQRQGFSLERSHLPFFPSLERWAHESVARIPPEIGKRYYQFLVDGRKAVLEVCRRLAQAQSQPTLIHCASGRDRTGIVIACVLSLIGVSDETIAADYAESHVMNDAEGRHADPGNILHMLRAVRDQHGSMATLLTPAHATFDPVQALRRALLA
jgi:protein-tyrosine phosphatase